MNTRKTEITMDGETIEIRGNEAKGKLLSIKETRAIQRVIQTARYRFRHAVEENDKDNVALAIASRCFQDAFILLEQAMNVGSNQD